MDGSQNCSISNAMAMEALAQDCYPDVLRMVGLVQECDISSAYNTLDT